MSVSAAADVSFYRQRVAAAVFSGLTFLGFLVFGPAAQAQVSLADYDELLLELDGRITFETLPQRDEPGFSLNAPLRVRGAWLGERFAGQMVSGTPHDELQGDPIPPLKVKPGAKGRNLSIAYHAGFGSNALFALGRAGFPDLTARGEGAVAILFDRDQAAFGLRLHGDYADPLGARAASGEVVIRLFNRRGDLIAEVRKRLAPGVTGLGLRRDGNIPDIVGVSITNTDPGGIALDDILFQLAALTS